MRTFEVTTVLGEKVKVNNTNTVCVVMTDKLLSGWGCAKGKTHKRVYVCKSSKEAHLLADRLYNPKHGMKYVKIRYGIPYYVPSRYTVAYDIFADDAFNF